MLKRILSLVTVVLVGIVVWAAWGDITKAVGLLGQLNLWAIAALIPIQAASYYMAGQVYFAYLKAKKMIKISNWRTMRISLEINFVNHVVPSGGVSGVGYLAWRLRGQHISAGQVTFVQLLRYVLAMVTTMFQGFVAILILGALGMFQETWIFWLSLLCVAGALMGTYIVYWIIKSRKRIDWVSYKLVWLINWLAKATTRGKHPQLLKEKVVDKFLMDLHGDYLDIRRHWKLIVKPYAWAALYSLFEVVPYWAVACAFGHPEVFLQLVLGQALGSVAGVVFSMLPGGVGGYDVTMVFLMTATGVESGAAIAIVLVTRVVLIIGTIVMGWPFYQQALMARKDKYKPVAEGA
jgi:uncharacterized protein (TIRG00374 family)